MKQTCLLLAPAATIKDDAVEVIGSKRYAECMDNVILELIEGETHRLNEFSMIETAVRAAEFLAE